MFQKQRTIFWDMIQEKRMKLKTLNKNNSFTCQQLYIAYNCKIVSAVVACLNAYHKSLQKIGAKYKR
jgi:hypothetical protein